VATITIVIVPPKNGICGDNNYCYCSPKKWYLWRQ
jgi:hypothetical protein